MFIKLLDYKVFSGTKKELLNLIDKKKKVNIVSGNPEILYTGLKNRELFKEFTNENSLIIPDGVGTVIASKIIGTPVNEKIAGIEILAKLLKKAEKEGKKVYFLGAKEDVIKSCVQNVVESYPEIKISGYHNGFFEIDNCEKIIKEINENKTNYLFIAMGCPRQENFIKKYMNTLNCEVFMGVGGSFDVIAGNVQRAPRWMINLGLEWFYRTIKEPFRIKRLQSIPKFLLIVLKSKIKGR